MMLGMGLEFAVGRWMVWFRFHPLRWELSHGRTWSLSNWIVTIGPFSLEGERV